MMKLNVSLERGGAMVRVGTICGNGISDAEFQYTPAYLADPAAAPLSVSLPLSEEPYSPAETAGFFEGLLPEGFTRRSVAQWMHVDEGDYLSILHGLGRECLGAVCVTEDGEEEEASYEPVTALHVRELAAEGAAISAEMVSRAHLSLAGASGKVGLYFSRDRDSWYLPRGTAPSTHIVKQSHVRLDAIVMNEQLSLRTAARCGIRVPESFIINTGSGAEHEVLFATRRFDRVFSEKPRMISGLPCPFRLHQEDFAQALGIPASAKYERVPGEHMKRMFALLKTYSSDPISDQLQLWDLIVFNYLIGNTDAHIKNFSLLYGSDLKQIRLAPAYDIISTTVYEQSTRDMAFSIGGDRSVDEITSESFRRGAKEAGLGESLAMRRYGELCKEFRPALRQSAEELLEKGYSAVAGLEQRILRTGGIGSREVQESI